MAPLFYQIFLSALAFCQDGIGYISTPIVGGRAGNAILFGSAQAERSVHVSRYLTRRKGARMWQSVLENMQRSG